MKHNTKRYSILISLFMITSIVVPTLVLVGCGTTAPSVNNPNDVNQIKTNANRIVNEFKITPKSSYLQDSNILEFINAINSNSEVQVNNYFMIDLPQDMADFTLNLSAQQIDDQSLLVDLHVASKINLTVSVTKSIKLTYVTNNEVSQQATVFADNFSINMNTTNIDITLNEMISKISSSDYVSLAKYFSFVIPNEDFNWTLKGQLKSANSIEVIASIQSKYVASVFTSKTFSFAYDTYRLDDGKYHVSLDDEYTFYKFSSYGDSFVTDNRKIDSRYIDSDIVGVTPEKSLLTLDAYADLLNSNPYDLFDVLKNTITVGAALNPGAYSILSRLTYLNYSKSLDINEPTADQNIIEIIQSKKNYRINRIELVPNSITKLNNQISFNYVLKRNYTVGENTVSKPKSMTVIGLNAKAMFVNAVSAEKYQTAIEQNNPFLNNTKLRIGQDVINDPDGTKYGSLYQKDVVNENYFRAFTFGYDIYNNGNWEKTENGTMWLLKRMLPNNHWQWYALTNYHVLDSALAAQAQNKTVNFFTKHALVTWEYSNEMINQAYVEVPGVGNQGLIDRAKILREPFRYDLNKVISQSNFVASNPSINGYRNDLVLLELDLSAMSYSKINKPAWKETADEFFLPQFETLSDLAYRDVASLTFGDNLNSFDSNGPLYYFSNPIPNDASRYSIEEVYKIYNKNNNYIKAGIGSAFEDSSNILNNPNLFFSHALVLGGSSGGMILNSDMQPVGIITSLLSSSKMSYVNGAPDIAIGLQLKPIFDYWSSIKDTDAKLKAFFDVFI